jgi:glucokinase
VSNAIHPPGGPEFAYPCLVADIGGTNARFGWIEARGTPVEHVRTLPAREHEGPADAARAYLQAIRVQLERDLPPPRRAALAVASAVGEDRVEFANSHWAFSRSEVQASLGLGQLLVLNDFEALALSLPRLAPSQLRTHGTLPVAAGTLAVVGPGTGLGVAGLVQTRHGWRAIAGEGGHVTIAAADAFEDDLLRIVRRTYPHVSAERQLSGIGLPVLHAAMCELAGSAAREATTEEIVRASLDRSDAMSERTIETFFAMLGTHCGNVALTLGARSGVFIGGGIVPRLGDRFFESRFRERFESKGRLRAYLQAIPTALITDTLAALSGAQAALEQDD